MRAKVARDAYDKEGYKRHKKEALAENQRELDENEARKRTINAQDPRPALRESNRRNRQAADIAAQSFGRAQALPRHRSGWQSTDSNQ